MLPDLNAYIKSVVNDPLAWVMSAYDWGCPELRGRTPDKWQIDILEHIRHEIEAGKSTIWLAVRSGHGIGKGALAAWVHDWFVNTRPYCSGVVTANTGTQLETKTWKELQKWQRLKMPELKDLVTCTATKFYHTSAPESWFSSAIPWSKEKPEAFAGTHAEHVLYLFDEASAIEDCIWETSEGAFTTGGIWLVLGNPTRTDGRFKECFSKYKHRWHGIKVDSRESSNTDKAQLQAWIDDYGIDSDFVKVRVLGEFPSASTNQFIGQDIIEGACNRMSSLRDYSYAPKILGVDVARYGEDASVLLRRQGSMVWRPKIFRNIDTMSLVGNIISEIHEFKPDAVFIDVIGVGSGVCDRLRQLGFAVQDVNSAAAPSDPQYLNKRAEMWSAMRDWLRLTGDIPADYPDLAEELSGPEYLYTPAGKLQIESKDLMKKRGLASPNIADALVYTFAYPMQSKRESDTYSRSSKPDKPYDPLMFWGPEA